MHAPCEKVILHKFIPIPHHASYDYKVDHVMRYYKKGAAV